MAMTEIPAGNTEIPAGNTEIPAGNTEIPAGYTEIPAGNTEIPVEAMTEIPAGNTEIPAGNIEIPAGNTPAGNTEIPAGYTEIPAGNTEIPVEAPAAAAAAKTVLEMPKSASGFGETDQSLAILKSLDSGVPLKDVSMKTSDLTPMVLEKLISLGGTVTSIASKVKCSEPLVREKCSIYRISVDGNSKDWLDVSAFEGQIPSRDNLQALVDAQANTADICFAFKLKTRKNARDLLDKNKISHSFRRSEGGSCSREVMDQVNPKISHSFKRSEGSREAKVIDQVKLDNAGKDLDKRGVHILLKLLMEVGDHEEDEILLPFETLEFCTLEKVHQQIKEVTRFKEQCSFKLKYEHHSTKRWILLFNDDQLKEALKHGVDDGNTITIYTKIEEKKAVRIFGSLLTL